MADSLKDYFGAHAADSEHKVGSPAVYRPSEAVVILAENMTTVGDGDIFAVLPSERTFHIENAGGATVRIDVSNDPNMGWNTSYISTSTSDFFTANEPWHYVKVVIEAQASPASVVTVKMGV